MRLRILFLSTCVGLRYGHLRRSLEDFLDSVESTSSEARRRPSPPYSRLRATGFAWKLPLLGGRAFPIARMPIFLCLPIVITCLRRCRNVDLLSIGYAFRPDLRDRLTLGGLTFPRKP